MSWVFLGEEFVYKLKKPVRYDFLDFSTIEARRRDCEREIELNRRLAGDVYLGMVALRVDAKGELTLSDEGRIVDWLTKMRRLPSERMLDAAIFSGTVTGEDVSRIGRLLTDFYRHTAAPEPMTPKAYRRRFERNIETNACELGRPEFELHASQIEHLTEIQRHFLANRGSLLEQRARDGRIVEAHGDLRPEHICLLREPVIIDCLEFKRDLRILDPLDELAYLALECERLGAPAVGTEVLRYYVENIGDGEVPELISFYKIFRSCLRAKIAVWHLQDHEVRDHNKWRERARCYLDLAMHYVSAC